MTMQDMYEEMKRALDYFGLRFHDMEKVKVDIVDGKMVFQFEKRVVVIS